MILKSFFSIFLLKVENNKRWTSHVFGNFLVTMLSGNGHACMYYCPSDLVPAWLALSPAYKIFLFYTGNFYCPVVTFLTICPKSVKKIHHYSFVTINRCLDNGNYNSRYLTSTTFYHNSSNLNNPQNSTAEDTLTHPQLITKFCQPYSLPVPPSKIHFIPLCLGLASQW